jgi:hypothetical protein
VGPEQPDAVGQWVFRGFLEPPMEGGHDRGATAAADAAEGDTGRMGAEIRVQAGGTEDGEPGRKTSNKVSVVSV